MAKICKTLWGNMCLEDQTDRRQARINSPLSQFHGLLWVFFQLRQMFWSSLSKGDTSEAFEESYIFSAEQKVLTVHECVSNLMGCAAWCITRMLQCTSTRGRRRREIKSEKMNLHVWNCVLVSKWPPNKTKLAACERKAFKKIYKKKKNLKGEQIEPLHTKSGCKMNRFTVQHTYDASPIITVCLCAMCVVLFSVCGGSPS